MSSCSRAPSPDDQNRRRSTRKRSVPSRYGFDEGDGRERKKCRTAAVTSPLLDLPEGPLRQILSFVNSSSGRFSLQCTCKLFCNISNSSAMLQNLNLLEAAGPNFIMDSPEESSVSVTQRLLPFAKNGNRDAIYLFSMIATYVEDDLEAGLSLFQKGIQEHGDNRAQYELGNLLHRQAGVGAPSPQVQTYFEEAASTGHALSLFTTARQSRRLSAEVKAAKKQQATKELMVTRSLALLIAKKPSPPRRRWAITMCSHPCCSRACYTITRDCRIWLKNKRFSADWQRLRSQVLPLGIPSSHYTDQDLYHVPDMNICSRCRDAMYCSRACQFLHWSVHKTECEPFDNDDDD